MSSYFDPFKLSTEHVKSELSMCGRMTRFLMQDILTFLLTVIFFRCRNNFITISAEKKYRIIFPVM